MALAVTGVAQAGYFVSGESKLSITFGNINNPWIFAGGSGSVTLVNNGSGGHDVEVGADVWATVNKAFGTSLYTGVPVITDFRITFANGVGTATSSFTAVNMINNAQSVIGPGMGGINPGSGQLLLKALGNTAGVFPLSKVGGLAGDTTTVMVFDIIPFEVTYMPWVTKAVVVTGITTNVISYMGVTGAGIAMRGTPGWAPDDRVVSQSGGFVTSNGGLPSEYHTVTIRGQNDLLSASQSGSISIVSPMRIDTTEAVSGRVPGTAFLDIVFVPEPGVMLLLVTGAVGLVVAGRRRARK